MIRDLKVEVANIEQNTCTGPSSQGFKGTLTLV
jgi:hypothetical protein